MRANPTEDPGFLKTEYDLSCRSLTYKFKSQNIVLLNIVLLIELLEFFLQFLPITLPKLTKTFHGSSGSSQEGPGSQHTDI